VEYETCIKMLEVWQEVEMIRSQKFGTKFQVAGYGGLENMKHMVVKHFPENIERFVEPFGGLGRITDLVKADEYFINDKSDYAYNFLKNKFPNYVVENLDYVDFIKKYATENSFIFCDPPWRKNIYKNHERPAFTEKNIITYYEKLLSLLPTLNCKWMIASDRDEHENGHRLQKSGYPNITMERKTGTGKFFGRNPAVRLCSNLFKPKENELLCDVCGYLAENQDGFDSHLERKIHLEAERLR
jgi:hypothetical protein